MLPIQARSFVLCYGHISTYLFELILFELIVGFPNGQYKSFFMLNPGLQNYSRYSRCSGHCLLTPVVRQSFHHFVYYNSFAHNFDALCENFQVPTLIQ